MWGLPLMFGLQTMHAWPDLPLGLPAQPMGPAQYVAYCSRNVKAYFNLCMHAIYHSNNFSVIAHYGVWPVSSFSE